MMKERKGEKQTSERKNSVWKNKSTLVFPQLSTASHGLHLHSDSDQSMGPVFLNMLTKFHT